jgi:NADPH-dependent glutamate synthase beta subunit-like oxidoreductase/Pyruvate/2-oxoacid:ferredoxin oxidoreductase delta subunit
MAVEIKKIKRAIGGRQFGTSAAMEQSSLRPDYSQKKPPCMDSCPNSEKIREYLQYIAQSEAYGRDIADSIREGFYILTDTNPLPGVTGRVCPHPCETSCNRTAKDTAVAINAVEMFIGDFGIEHKLPLRKLTDEKRKEKVAVVGSGPAGLSCAYQLVRRGYSVTVFEKFEKAGGMLRYGIPSFRLPDDILDAEIEKIKNLGVEFTFNSPVGNELTIEHLKKEFDAVFIGIGAYSNISLGINESGISSVFSGLEFLRRVNMGELPDLGRHIIIVGGGDSAMDCARTARRLPTTEKVTVVYRRGREQMPANPEEVAAAIKEGIDFEFMAAPVDVNLDKKGSGALSVSFQKTRLGEKDASGRAQFIMAEGDDSVFTLECSALIASLGQKPDFSGLESLSGNLKKGYLNIDDKGLINGEDNVFAGGDAIGFWLVTQAIGSGNSAAFSIHEKLSGEPVPVDKSQIITNKDMHLEFYNTVQRNERQEREITEVKGDFQPVVYGLSKVELVQEAKRCLSCGLCYDCGNCFMYCSKGCVKMLQKGQHYEFHLETCNGCAKCFESCPCGYITMS